MNSTSEIQKKRVASRVQKMEEKGFYQRGADILHEHEAALREYGESAGIKSLGEMIASLLIDFEDQGGKVTKDTIQVVADKRASQKAKRTGFFLSEEQFRAIRDLQQRVNPLARKSLTNGLATLIEISMDLGILKKTNNKEKES